MVRGLPLADQSVEETEERTGQVARPTVVPRARHGTSLPLSGMGSSHDVQFG